MQDSQPDWYVPLHFRHTPEAPALYRGAPLFLEPDLVGREGAVRRLSRTMDWRQIKGPAGWL